MATEEVAMPYPPGAVELAQMAKEPGRTCVGLRVLARRNRPMRLTRRPSHGVKQSPTARQELPSSILVATLRGMPWVPRRATGWIRAGAGLLATLMVVGLPVEITVRLADYPVVAPQPVVTF